MRKFLAVAALLAMWPIGASAATISFTESGSTLYTAAMTGFATTGSLMAGMGVTVNGSGGTWGDLGGGVFGVTINGVTVSVGTGTDTFDAGAWNLTVPNGFFLTSLGFDGTSGNTTFDRTFGNVEGTPGSALGADFAGFADPIFLGGSIRVDYMNPLGIGAALPVGDEFVKMLLTFAGATGGGLGPGTYSFRQDTDNATTTPGPDPVIPEPASLLLLGTGLLGVAGRAWRERRP